MLERYFPRFDSDIFSDLKNFREQINRLFNEVVQSDQFLTSYQFYPRLNVIDQKDQYVILAELPGVNKADVKLTVQDGFLTISGERKEFQLPKDAEWLRREIGFGKFSRAVNVPDDADLDKIEAKFEDGMLTITIKKQETKKPKEIEISIN